MRRACRWLLTVLFVLQMGCCCNKGQYECTTGCPMPVKNVYANPTYPHAEVLNCLLLPLDDPMHIADFSMYEDDMVLEVVRSFGKEQYFSLQYDPQFNESQYTIVDLETGMIDRVRLGAIGEKYNSEAVLKVSINDYRPFPPMRMKVKAALIDTRTGERIWAFDQVFDADDADVINAMKLWWNSNIAGGDTRRNRFDLATVRPSFFNKFVFHTMARSYVVARVANAHAAEAKAAAQAGTVGYTNGYMRRCR